MIKKCIQPRDGKNEYGYFFFFFVVVFFLAITGFPSFRFLYSYNFIILPFILYVIFKKHRKIPRNVVIVLIFIMLLSVVQVFLGHLTDIGGIAMVLTMAVALCSALMMGRTLLPVFVKVMQFFAVTSLVIWLSVVLFPGMHSFLSNLASNLPQMMSEDWIEHNSNEGLSLYLYYLPTKTSTAYTSFIRNNGPFYEPGLFASYLNIALVFNLCKNRTLLDKDNISLILAILSTCSSAGYVSFLLVVVFSAFIKGKIRYKIITVIAIVFLWQPIMELDFMEDKIMSNYGDAQDSSASRFGAMIYHWEKVQQSPVVGYAGGVIPITHFDRMMMDKERILSPNGLTYLFVFWGIPLGIYFYYLLYNGFRKLVGIKEKSILISLYVVILSTAFSQTITTDLFVLTLAALSFTLTNNNYENCSYSYL